MSNTKELKPIPECPVCGSLNGTEANYYNSKRNADKHLPYRVVYTCDQEHQFEFKKGMYVPLGDV